MAAWCSSTSHACASAGASRNPWNLPARSRYASADLRSTARADSNACSVDLPPASSATTRTPGFTSAIGPCRKSAEDHAPACTCATRRRAGELG